MDHVLVTFGYILGGGVLGGIGTYTICKIIDDDFTHHYLRSSQGGFHVTMGIIIGATVGVGMAIGRSYTTYALKN